MKRQVRYGAFETNSSSNHVIIVTKNDKVLTENDVYQPNSDRDYNENLEYIWLSHKTGEWRIYNEEDLYFGRGPFQLLTSLGQKTEYAIASLCGEWSGYTDEEKVANLAEIQCAIQEVLPELSWINLPTKEIPIFEDLDGNELPENKVEYNWKVSKESAMFRYYVKDGKKHPAKKTNECYEEPDVPGIDHQSADLLKNFLKSHNITIKDFLLNKKYVVVVDSDEICAFSDFKTSGLYAKDQVVEEYSAWGSHNYTDDPECEKEGVEEDNE